MNKSSGRTNEIVVKVTLIQKLRPHDNSGKF